MLLVGIFAEPTIIRRSGAALKGVSDSRHLTAEVIESKANVKDL